MKKRLLSNLIWLIAAAWVYTFTFIFNNYWSRYASYSSVTTAFETALNKKETAFNSFTADTALLYRLHANSFSRQDLDAATNQPFFLYLFENDGNGFVLQFWNTNSIIPSPTDVPYNATNTVTQIGKGHYQLISKTVVLRNIPVSVVALIPIRQEFFITNERLAAEYPGFPELDKQVRISRQVTPYGIKNAAGKNLFYFEAVHAQSIPVFNWPSFLVQALATVLLLLFISHVARSVVVYGKLYAGLVIMTGGLLLLRWMILRYSVPMNVVQFRIFDPVATGVPVGFPSLGALLLNAICISWLLFFIRMHESTLLLSLQKLSAGLKRVCGVFICLLIVCFHFGCVLVLGSMVVNSTVSFDVTNFFSLDETTLIGFIVIFLLVISHFRFMHLALQMLRITLQQKDDLKFLFIALFGMVLLTLLIGHVDVRMVLASLGWLLLVTWFKKRTLSTRIVNLTTGSTFVLWMMFYAVSLTVLFSVMSGSRQKARTIQLAEKLGNQTDLTSRQQISLASTGVYANGLANMFSQLLQPERNRQIKDSIIGRYFRGYISQFDTHIYFYDAADRPLYNDDSTSIDVFNTIYTQQASPTGNARTVYFEDSYERFSYLYKNTIYSTTDTGVLLGHIFILSRPGKYKNEALYPELFRQLNNFVSDLPPGYSYAIYQNGRLVNQNKNYGFSSEITEKDIPRQLYEFRSAGEAEALWYNFGNGRVAVVVYEARTLLESITLFAYLFLSVMLLVFAERMLLKVVTGRIFKLRIKDIFQFNIRTQLQGTIVFVSVFSFFIIGVVTIKFFTERFKTNNNDKLSRYIQTIAAEVKTRLPQGFEQLSRAEKRDELHDLLTAITTNLNLDVNCFDLKGELLATTQPIVFENHIIGTRIDPKAFYTVQKDKQNQYTQEEAIGKMEYTSVYVPARDDNGHVFGVLQAQYFASETELNQEISSFLVALINLNAFIFLIAGAIALFISSRITSSFTLIGDKMRRMELGKQNEPIVWNNHDEIGVLVQQYNRMVLQLEASATKLARSEREFAWREMARQVAHEIKNPLTPMKLSLQFLQRAIDENSPSVKTLASQVAQNLVEQINHLSAIASDFSQFANIGTPRLELFDLHDVLQQVIYLHDKQEHVNITWQPVEKPVMIEADKTQINRLFTNLVQNAYEALDGRETSEIVVHESLSGQYITITIADNGGGIPEEIQGRIFTPNFTTKTSGTGLGLAICKDIVEKANGNIWFETEAGRGTTFFIKLPVQETPALA